MKLIKKVVLCVAFCLLIFIIAKCDSTEPPIEAQGLVLKHEDVSCTEAWIELSTINLQLPATVTLKRNNQIRTIINLVNPDSLLFIDSLLPNTNYTFQSFAQQINQTEVTSNVLSMTTMDTTSHNFTWQIFEFGIISYQSHLFDVAIINENYVIAVGSVFLTDSLGQPDPQPYGIAIWNGQSWELKKLFYDTNIPVAPRGIFVISPDEIYLASGSIFKWDGVSSTIQLVYSRLNLPDPNGTIENLWGSSNSSIYGVGNTGSIVYFNGTLWIQMESGTDLSLADIAVNNLGQIYICGGNSSFGQGIILKSTNGNNFTTFVEGANIPESELFNPYLYGSFSSIWFDQNSTLYSGGNILFQNKFNNWDYVRSLPENFIGGNPGTYYRGYITKVRGNASNDMWIVGDRNTLRHFNGLTWQQIGMPYDPQMDLTWRGISCNSSNTVIVGSHERSAIIMMIKK